MDNLAAMVNELSLIRKVLVDHRNDVGRPSRHKHIIVTFDPDEESYKCKLPYGSIIGVGKTPEAACEDFDRLWLHGHRDENTHDAHRRR